MKRKIALILVITLSISVLAGCGPSAVKIDLDQYNYSVREDTTEPFEDAELSPQAREYLDRFMDALTAAIDDTPAEAYTFDFSDAGLLTEEEARNHLIPALVEKYGEDRIIEKTRLDAIGIWAVPMSGRIENDVKEIWISAYENPDGNTEFVIDVLREKFTLKTLRYELIQDGSLREKQSILAPNHDGREPQDPEPLIPEETSGSKTLYFGGRLYKTGIFEVPVLNSIDFVFRIEGKPVPGSGLPGGFAGGFEGVVTIDGQSFPLTLDGAGITIPIGMLENPSEYYVAFSDVGIANPQDTTKYRNVYFIKTDLSSVVGLYFINKRDTYYDWFETARISSDTFSKTVKSNNEKLTDLYTKIIVETYGDRREYNYLLAVLYNMFIGVEQNYLIKNLKQGISSISKNIRDYTDAIKDPNVSRLGQNNMYFFPDGRSMVIRLFEYDGESAIAAIDFSSKQDDGYGALYRAEYVDGEWNLITLKPSRIAQE